VDSDHKALSQRHQCQLLGVNRSSLYYIPAAESEYNIRLMNLLDEQYTRTPFYGVRKMTQYLNETGHTVNIKRVRRLLRKMGLEAIYPKPNLSKANTEHKVYPYLLKGLDISRCNQVWSSDITYIRLKKGFVYLMAIIDWFSRYVLSWRLSNSLDVLFCIDALREALEKDCPVIFNTDQGSQFTSNEHTRILLDKGIKISMDSKGRALDNIFVGIHDKKVV